MKLVGDGCSDPLNRAFEEDLSSSSVDASERVASEFHGSSNNSERVAHTTRPPSVTTSEGELAEGAQRRLNHGVGEQGNSRVTKWARSREAGLVSLQRARSHDSGRSLWDAVDADVCPGSEADAGFVEGG